ncbi:hypothetical protein ABK040_011075 [Willaertia magna]
MFSSSSRNNKKQTKQQQSKQQHLDESEEEEEEKQHVEKLRIIAETISPSYQPHITQQEQQLLEQTIEPIEENVVGNKKKKNIIISIDNANSNQQQFNKENILCDNNNRHCNDNNSSDEEEEQINLLTTTNNNYYNNNQILSSFNNNHYNNNYNTNNQILSSFNKNFTSKELIGISKKKFFIRDTLVRFRYSILYGIYLLIMILLALFLFAWSIYRRGRIEELWFVILEGICTFALVHECLFSLYLYKSQWYKSIVVWTNIIISILSLIMFAILLYCYIETEENYIWNQVAFAQEVVIILHCVINSCRVIIYILQLKRTSTKNKKIDLTIHPHDNNNTTTITITNEINKEIDKSIDNNHSKPMKVNNDTNNNIKEEEDLTGTYSSTLMSVYATSYNYSTSQQYSVLSTDQLSDELV